MQIRPLRQQAPTICRIAVLRAVAPIGCGDAAGVGIDSFTGPVRVEAVRKLDAIVRIVERTGVFRVFLHSARP